MDINLGVLKHTPESLEAFFRLEHDERRGTREVPGGFQPSSAFGDIYQQFRAFKQRYVDNISDRLKAGDTVSRTEIDNIKSLQRVSLAAEFDYKGDHYKSRLRQLENGGTGGNQPTWKIMEMRATQAGLLEGEGRESVRIRVDHGARFETT